LGAPPAVLSPTIVLESGTVACSSTTSSASGSYSP
jgi:hypothetical protein